MNEMGKDGGPACRGLLIRGNEVSDALAGCQLYTEPGGCIDTTHEFSRWVHPGTAELLLPAV